MWHIFASCLVYPAGVSQLVEFGVAYELWRVHVRDFAVWLVAFIITAFAGVEMGLLASIALSLLIMILETAFPHTALLGRLGTTNVYRCEEGWLRVVGGG
jgi:MFS superfamily sulfate permease-like transporter